MLRYINWIITYKLSFAYSSLCVAPWFFIAIEIGGKNKSEVKTEWCDFSFVKLCYVKETAGLNETQFHSLTAGGAYRTVIQQFLGCHCKHSSVARINTHLNALYRGKMKIKCHVNFSENSQFPSETHSYKIQYLGFLYFIYIMNSDLVTPAMVFSPLCVCLCLWPHKWHLGKLLQCSLCASTEQIRCSKIKQKMAGRTGAD